MNGREHTTSDKNNHLVTSLAILAILLSAFSLFVQAYESMTRGDRAGGPTVATDADENYTSKSVLFLSSYSPSFETLSDQLTGIRSTLDRHGIYYDVEYMYTKTNNSEDYFSEFYNILKMRLATMHYDGLIVGDDQALRFVIRYQNELFPDIPIAFFGVNDVSIASVACSMPHMTGSIEPTFLKDNIDFALSLYPRATRIVAIVDGTVTGEADQATFMQRRSQYPDLDFEVLNSSRLTRGELGEQVASYRDDTILLFMSAVTDVEENYYTLHSQVSYLSQKAQIPIFHSDANNVGDGVLGGITLDFEKAAASAAETLLEAFKGKDIGKMPLDENPASVFQVDEKLLEKYSIPMQDIPKNAEIINHDKSFWESYYMVMIPFFIIAAALVALLLQSRRSFRQSVKYGEELARSQEELKEKNELLRHMSFYDALTDLKNRHALEEDMESFEDEELVVLFWDLNHFKDINDTYGHKVGDEALASFAGRLRFIFPGDACYRYGGDEFLVILHEEGEHNPSLIERIASCREMTLGEGMVRVTSSCGYTWGCATSEAAVLKMIRKADDYNYMAKKKKEPVGGACTQARNSCQ